MSNEMNHMSDDLLVKYILDECTERENAEVKKWLALREENELYYLQYKHIWEESKGLDCVPEMDTNEAWERLKRRMVKPARAFRIQRTWYYAAACILLMGGLFSLYQYLRQGPADVHMPLAVSIPAVLQSKQETLIDTLSDRSVVTLNRNAALHYPKEFAAAERRVQLKGEAFFNITPNKQKPFFIDAANDVEIRVVGTSFNVKSFDAYTEVIVETGIVEVRKFNKVVLLHPREKARINREDSSIVVEKHRDKLYRYFRSKEFECDNTPLWKVVEVLNEAYGDSVIIGRNELKGLTLTTRFDNESLESILEIISETFEITVEKKGNKYILK